jgi:histidine triad (HIT) family protein
MEARPFCGIARKEFGAEIVYEDDLIVAFLDCGPIRPGHTQIIPRAHTPYFEDLPELTANRVIQLGQRLSRGMKVLFGVERVAFLFTGGDVAHAHAHVLPMHEKTDITSRLYIAEETLTFRSTPRAPPDDLAKIASQIRRVSTP